MIELQGGINVNPVQKKKVEKKSILRLEYESYLGSAVCDRTWRRVKTRFHVHDENCLDDVVLIRGAAILRSFNASARITYTAAQQYGLIAQHFYPDGCTQIYGRDVAIAIETCFTNRRGKPPRRETLWKWGLKRSEVYSLEQVKGFLRRAYLSGFLVRANVPKVQQIYLVA